MVIRIKRIYEPVIPEHDGYRVLVDRLWPRGLRKDQVALDEWAKDIAPSATLRKAFHNEQLDWPAFCSAYRQELDGQRVTLQRLAAQAGDQTLTLLFSARNTERNHAIVLRDYLEHLQTVG